MKSRPTCLWQTLFGFCLSFLFAWLVSAFFCDSLVVYVWDDALQKNVIKQGTVRFHRSEGWGKTVVGEHNIIGSKGLADAGRPILAVHGDSYVEGFQVDDDEKIGNQIVALCGQNTQCDFVAMNIGQSGYGVADYYFDIGRFEGLYPHMAAHFLVITGVGDLLPDKPSLHANFVSVPENRLVPSRFNPPFQTIKELAASARLDFLWHLFVKTYAYRLRFAPDTGIAQNTDRDVNASFGSPPIDAWRFLLSRLKAQAAKPVVFVYAPSVPVIRCNEIDMTDRNETLIKPFEVLCQEYGIGFINMKQPFIDYYLRSGQFCRGFANSKPSKGHFNSAGHRLIAKEIIRSVVDKDIFRYEFRPN